MRKFANKTGREILVRGMVAVACGFLLLGGAGASALELNPAEQAYVHSAGVIDYCVDPDWPPFEVINAQGVHVGIAADLLQLVAERTGLSFRLLPTRDWQDSLAASKAGRCKFLSFLNQSAERDRWLIFTEPLLTDASILVTREEHPYVIDLAALSAQTMVLPKGTSVEERVRRDFPNIRVLTVESEADTFELVNERRADLTLRSLIVAAYTIKREGWFNLKIAGQVPQYDNHLRIGVLKDEVLLRDVLDKGIASITRTERDRIVDQRIEINVVKGLDYTLIRWLLGLMIAIVLTSLFWIRKLRQLNAELAHLSRTDALTGLLNRGSADRVMAREYDRVRRFKRPLSVILFDIDFFKKINDDFGHLEGDKALSAVASLIRREIRAIDQACRWGGEEFLVICPETDERQAIMLAERILQRAALLRLSVGRTLTLSAGVAALDADDAPQLLFRRADEALLTAKRNGRNRVVASAAERPEPKSGA